MTSWSEPPEEAWRQRYGVEPPELATAVGPFLEHRSVRRFSDRPVSEETVSALIGAAQSAATSSNLQMWSVISVQDRKRREQVAMLCADQEQIRNAAWFFAFLADHHRLKEAAAQIGENAEGLGYMEYLIMAIIDVALAAERFVCAAESLGLGICYIGALRNDPEGVKQLLGLPASTFGAFGLCLGWPEQPVVEHIKPKLSQSAVWFRELYELQPDTTEYDARMQGFYESEHMKGSVTWSMRSGRRVDRHHLTGREVLKEWLPGQGFGTE